MQQTLAATIASDAIASTAPSPTAAPVAGATTSTVDGKASVTITSQATLPSTLASQIIPATADQSDSAPADSSIVSLLFTSALSWPLMLDNSDAMGQVVTFVPKLVASSLNITQDQVQVQSLVAYTPDSFNGTNLDVVQTVMLLYIPSSMVDALAAMVATPNSLFYTASQGIENQIANLVVSNYSLRSYATTTAGSPANNAADSSGSSNKSGGDSDKSKTIIIAVVVSFGCAILLVAAILAYRASRTIDGAIALPPSASRRSPPLRQFQLGSPGEIVIGGGGLRDSTSSAGSGSTASTGYGGDSRHPTSSDSRADERSSWWRFSGQSHDFSSGHGHGQPDVREGPRRISVLRGPNGQINSGAIGRCVLSLPFLCRLQLINHAPTRRPQIQSNSLMLD